MIILVCHEEQLKNLHIEELATNIESTLKELASKFVYYSLAIDKSADITSTAQLAVFVRRIDQEFNITEEMLGLQAMKDTTSPPQEMIFSMK